jgi:hypothetical protein
MTHLIPLMTGCSSRNGVARSSPGRRRCACRIKILARPSRRRQSLVRALRVRGVVFWSVPFESPSSNLPHCRQWWRLTASPFRRYCRTRGGGHCCTPKAAAHTSVWGPTNALLDQISRSTFTPIAIVGRKDPMGYEASLPPMAPQHGVTVYKPQVAFMGALTPMTRWWTSCVIVHRAPR